MSRSLYERRQFFRDCDKMHRAAEERREHLKAQHMGHMERVFASKDAVREFRRTGDNSRILRLQQLGVFVETVL